MKMFLLVLMVGCGLLCGCGERRAQVDVFGAIRAGDVQGVAECLRAGVSANTNGVDGVSALELAARCGESNVVRVLLRGGAVGGNRFLLMASHRGEADVVAALLDGGVGPDYSYGGRTALMLAAGRGHVEVVRLLVGHGARLEAVDLKGNTALAYAAANGSDEVVHVLEMAGAVSLAAGQVVVGAEVDEGTVVVELEEEVLEAPRRVVVDEEFVRREVEAELAKQAQEEETRRRLAEVEAAQVRQAVATELARQELERQQAEQRERLRAKEAALEVELAAQRGQSATLERRMEELTRNVKSALSCWECRGKGMVVCQLCQGEGSVFVPGVYRESTTMTVWGRNRWGMSWTDPAYGVWRTCLVCKGKRELVCLACKGTGKPDVN